VVEEDEGMTDRWGHRDDASALPQRPHDANLEPTQEHQVVPHPNHVVPSQNGSNGSPSNGNGAYASNPATSVATARRPREARPTDGRATGGDLVAHGISAWFGSNKVLENVDLHMHSKTVTALIGPSGCGKSTFLRILNRMHELVPSAALAGSVTLDGNDIYATGQRPTDTRRRIGMVFQKPNPFPAMSIYDNVLAGPRLTRTPVANKDALVEESLRRAGLWNEVRGRLNDAGGALSGGQQQRLCIARALAIRPNVLLMDEPCSALDPTSTRRIEETIAEIGHEVTIVIVTHNMQQAQRVSDRCAFFMAGENEPGRIIEEGPTELIFNNPQDPQTFDYVNGRFG
jgi:phosphate transport system ATP-binding protein